MGLEYSRVLYVEIVHGIFRPSKDYFKKRSDYAKSSKKNYVGFPGYWFLASEFPRVATQFCEIYKDGICLVFCLVIPRVK